MSALALSPARAPLAAASAPPAADPFDVVAEWLKALSDPTRLRLLHAMKEGGELCVTDLLAGCSCSQANVSRHLAVLREHRLVSSRRDGMRILYRIADPAVFIVCETVCKSTGRRLPKTPPHPAPASQEDAP